MAEIRAQRRLAAILAADVVGYSRLVEADEAGTLAALGRLRSEILDPLLATHHGRIVKLMGDGVIAEFGSVVDAVSCAVALQTQAAAAQANNPPNRRMVYRIGINLGDVVVEGDDLLGDGVNVAARLEQICEPGGILISGTAYDHLQGKVDLPLDYRGEQHVKNIARNVRTYSVRLNKSRRSWRLDARRLRRWLLPAATVLVLLVGGLGTWLRPWEPRMETASVQRMTLPLPDKPSIAVLPFDNRSDDQRLGRLADGMVEDIIIDLSRFRELFVIARTSSFVYRDKPADVRQIGRDLGVRYVLEGQIQSGNKGLTVDTQLIDTTTGTLVWSQDYDGPLDDLFTVQADIASRIAGSIGGAPGALRRAVLDVAHRRSPQSLEAYDLFLLGNEARLRLTQADHGKAMEFLKKAVALDPTFQPAHVALAFGYWSEVDYSWAPYQSAMDGWLKEAQQAVDLDPGDALGHVALGLRYGYANDFDRNATEFDTALRANFNDPDALSLIGGQLAWLEPPGRAVELVERAQRLNPLASKISHMSKLAYYFAGDFERAIAKCKAHGDLGFFDYEYLALSYGELGKLDEARANSAKVLRLRPLFSGEWALTYLGEFAPAAAVNRALFLDGLTKAGLPHCATARQIAGDPGIKHLAECDVERSHSN